MKLHEMYKEKMIDVLSMMYGDKIDKEKLSEYLDGVIAAKSPAFPTLWMRNLYTTKNFGVKMDDILDIIKDNDLCVEANNTLTYSLNKVDSPIPRILIKNKAERNRHKKLMLGYKEEMAVLKQKNEYFEGCPIETAFKNENGYQLKVKVFMNSIYGVQGQRGSIIYAPDTAGAVTSQGRELISEMTWTMERLLYGTCHFYSTGEFLSFLNTIKNEVHEDSPLLDYIDYWPTVEDVKHQMVKYIHKTKGLNEQYDKISVTMYHFIMNLNPVERVYFYYKCNFMEFISRNKKVFELFDGILRSKTEFICTAPGRDPTSDNPKDHNYGLEEFQPALDKICELADEFVIVNMSTPKRTHKYQNKRRRGIVVSDTDSVIINLHPYVANLYKLHCIHNNIPYRGEHVGFYDEAMDFKLINIVTYICVHATVVAGDILVKQSNVPEELRKWIEMKNEFLFKRLCMYTNAKKNYIVNTRLQEGKIIDDVSSTGIKINSSVIHPDIKEKIMTCITDRILKTENIDPILIMKDVKEIERFIIRRIQEGDFTLGRRARFSGIHGYKTGVYQNDSGRSAYIWNLLYPNYKIGTGDYGYIFNTTLYTKDDVIKKMSKRFPEEAKMLIDLVFENPNEPKLAPYGLRSIMIPISESITKLPDWLIPFIDYPRLTNKHLQPIISLLPSVNLRLSALTSSKSTYSPLVTFS